jgi:zinc transport system substrate-binding protein
MALMEAKGHSQATPTPPGGGQGGKNDPHIWLDFSLNMNIVDMIASAFSEKDPANAAYYRANAEIYKSKLDALDREYQSSLSPCRQRQMILGGHSAFGYLTQRYGLQQIALYGISPNAEPTPKKLAEVVQAAKNHKVKFIFFESLVNPKLAQVLAKEAGLGTLLLHTGHNVTKEQIKNKTTFLELMEINLNNLRRGLGCDK